MRVAMSSEHRIDFWKKRARWRWTRLVCRIRGCRWDLWCEISDREECSRCGMQREP